MVASICLGASLVSELQSSKLSPLLQWEMCKLEVQSWCQQKMKFCCKQHDLELKSLCASLRMGGLLAQIFGRFKTIDFASQNKKEWVVLFLNFCKAFDSVSHIFLFTLLSSMGFPPSYMAWVTLKDSQVESMVRNKGWLSSHLFLKCGVRQGCPLSCHLLNLVGQVVVLYLQFRGIFAWWTYQSDPNSLYVDDIALILEHCDLIPKVIKLIQWCWHFTGLHLNVSKTVAYAPHITKPFCIEGIRVSNKPIKYLGVWVGDSTECQDKMFSDILSKIHKVATKWRHRTLTLSAWLLVLKCMIFSINIHTFTNIFFSNDILETLQHIANDFLWRGWNRLKQQKCWNTPKWGGLNHLHVKLYL